MAVTTATLAIAAPVSGASAAITPIGFPGGNAVGPQTDFNSGCGTFPHEGVGPAGSVTPVVCGNALAFVGPMIGQLSSVVGPTIIGSTVLAPVTASNGSVAANTIP